MGARQLLDHTTTSSGDRLLRKAALATKYYLGAGLAVTDALSKAIKAVGASLSADEVYAELVRQAPQDPRLYQALTATHEGGVACQVESRAARLVSAILEGERKLDPEVAVIQAELKAAGLDVRKDSQAAFLYLEEPDEDQARVAFDVFPRAGWDSFVRRSESGASQEDWTEVSAERAKVFEKILGDHGYILGSVGGTPPNFDYSKKYGDVTVDFLYWGNPHHI